MQKLGVEKHAYGVVNGRSICANDLAVYFSTSQGLEVEGIVGKGKLFVSTSCSLLHTALLILIMRPSWVMRSSHGKKIVEVNALAKVLSSQKDEAFFSSNAAGQVSRKSSSTVTGGCS